MFSVLCFDFESLHGTYVEIVRTMLILQNTNPYFVSGNTFPPLFVWRIVKVMGGRVVQKVKVKKGKGVWPI